MYVQLHIEQGPVLEAEGLPLGVVEAIAGQTRLTVSIMNAHVSYLCLWIWAIHLQFWPWL